MQRGLDSLGERGWMFARRSRFDLEVQLCESAFMEDVHPVFRDVRERRQNVVNRGRVHIHSTNDYHIVCATEDASPEQAGFRRGPCADEVTGPVAEDGPVISTERGEEEFACLPGRGVGEGCGIHDFSDVPISEDLQGVVVRWGEKCGRADLGHAVVIEKLGVGPECLKTGAQGEGEATRFSRNDDVAEVWGRREMEGLGGFGEVQCVGRGAAEDGGIAADEILQPSGRGLSACRVGGCAETDRGLEGGPEPEEGAEGECEEDPLCGGDAEGMEAEDPVLQHPVPVVLRIGNEQRRGGGAAGLGEPRIISGGSGQIGPEVRVQALVGNEFRLGEGWD